VGCNQYYSLKAFFMAIYSKAGMEAVKRQRKQRAAKAKKTLEKLALSSEVIQALVNKKAAQMAWAMQKKAKPAPKPKFEPAPKYQQCMGKEFYRTNEWRSVRYKVLVKYGKKCQCCSETGGYIHVDHILPRSLHPHLELDENNLQVLCEACNMGKSNKDTTDWR
jgi:hypothetical protein